MMLWLYLVILMTMAMISYLHTKRIYNPGTVFAGLWSLLCLLAGLKLYGLKNFSDTILNIMLIGNIGFFLGTFRKTRKIVFGKKIKSKENATEFGTNSVVFVVMIVFCCAALLYRFSFQLPYLISGRSISDIRYSGEPSYTQWSLILFNYFALPFLDAATTVILANNVINNKSLKHYIGPILLLVMSVMSNGARLAVYQMLVIFVFALLINGKLKIKWANFKRYLPVVAAIVAMIIFVNGNRAKDVGAEGTNFLQGVYRYFCGSFVFGDYVLTETSFFADYLYGVNSFGGVLRPIIALLGFVGVKSPALLTLAGDFMSKDMQNTVIIVDNSGKLYNYFCTCFTYFYKDGGIIAVVVVSFIYGMICRYFFDRLDNKMTVQTLSIYLYILSGIMISMMHFCFAVFIYVMTLVYIYILTQYRIGNLIIFGKHKN